MLGRCRPKKALHRPAKRLRQIRSRAVDQCCVMEILWPRQPQRKRLRRARHGDIQEQRRAVFAPLTWTRAWTRACRTFPSMVALMSSPRWTENLRNRCLGKSTTYPHYPVPMPPISSDEETAENNSKRTPNTNAGAWRDSRQPMYHVKGTWTNTSRPSMPKGWFTRRKGKIC